MNLTASRHGDILAILVSEPRLDAACVVSFKDAARTEIADHKGRVLLDITAVQFIDSSGLGALVGVMKMLDGRKLELAGAGEVVRKVLSLTRMDQVFVLHETRQAALSSRSAA